MEEQDRIKGRPSRLRFPDGPVAEKEENLYYIDPRLLAWVKNNVESCPQTLEEFAKITRLDRWQVNRSKSTTGYETPSWLVTKRGDFSIIGEMKELLYLRLQEIEIEDFSFLRKCRKLQMLDLQHTNFTDCSLLEELSDLRKAYLPPRSQLIHTEVLERLSKKAEPIEIQVPEPFYKEEDFQNCKIVDGAEAVLSYQGNRTVRCVSVDFAGKEPSAWRGFAHGDEDCWGDLSEEVREKMIEQLAEAVRHEKVHSLLLSLEPWGEGHYLGGEFAGGWAALFYDDNDQGVSYSVYNADYDTVEILAPVEIGGQSPVPKMMALEDLELAARIVSHFLRTGQLCPGTKWVKDGEEEEKQPDSLEAPAEIICIGQALIDCIIRGREPYKENVDCAEEILLNTGGDALNEACVLEKLGHHAKLICGLGLDLAGELVLKKAGSSGVDVSEVTRSERLTTPIASLTVGKDGSRTSCNSRATMLTGFLPELKELKGVKVVSLASLFRAPLDQKDTIIRLIRQAKMAGAVVCADTKIPTFRSLSLEDLEEVLPLIDYFFPNEKEAEYMTGETDERKMAEALRKTGIRNVIVKTGEKGCMVCGEKEAFHMPAMEVRAVDSTGAGDSFVAGFISGILAGDSLRDCCKRGIACAAECVQRMGAV